MIFPWLPFSLKILNSKHFYGTVQFISHFTVSPQMAADAVSVLPFYLNWKYFSDFPNVLSSSLAKTIYRQRWSNAHVMAASGWFNGYVCHFPFTLSFIFRPDAPRIWPYPLPEQHTIPIPCGCKAWTEEHHTSSTSPSSCSSRLISSSGTAEHLRILSCTWSTSIGTVLYC